MGYALDAARQEELNRRKETIYEIQKLKNAVGEITDEIKSLAIEELSEQIIQHRVLMKYLNDEHNGYEHHLEHPLRDNKLVVILKGAIESIKNTRYDELDECLPVVASQKTILGFNPEADVSNICTKFTLGNPALNFIQTGLLSLLAVKQGANTFDELNLDGIYDPLTSPNIQTTAFPIGFNISSVEGLANDFWISDGELALPMLGCFHGGSRTDEKYANKPFRAEDEFSAVAKWTGSSPLSAWHFKIAAHQSECETHSFICAKIQEKFAITHKASVGDVYVKGEHIGLVNHIYDDGVIESLNYDRYKLGEEELGHKNIKGMNFTSYVADDEVLEELIYTPYMPKDGLGYSNTTCNEGHECLFFAVKGLGDLAIDE